MSQPGNAPEIDRQFVKEIVEHLGTTSERRVSERFPYTAVQQMAPFVQGQPPGRDMFREVRCHDISRGGVSFYWRWHPDFEQAVIALGTAPNLSFMKVQILGCVLTDITLPEYLVRCRFLEKLECYSR